MDALVVHRALVDALARRLAGPVERIETHISTLLLAGDQAYKLRKPLKLDFLDFSSAARRRADCEDELRLNRRTAPQLYLDVLPVLGPPDAARFGRPDEAALAIDWALRMRRFDNDELLDRLATRGALGSTDVDHLARGIAEFHAALPASPAAFGDPQGLLGWTRANFDALASMHGERLAPLRDWSEREFARRAPLLAQRRAQGFVRECHGDLHLGNIVRVDGVPLPFDAIEFNPALRHTDVMADVAFTFMDLQRHGLPGLAWRFASAYADATGDHGGFALLPWLACYRAMVRARVAALRGAQAGDAAARAAAAAALERDLDTAQRMSRLATPAPRLLLTCGLSGSGKSTAAQHLLQALGALRLRSDVERKRLAGLAPTARSTPQEAARLYSRATNARVYAQLGVLARRALRAGLNVIVDAAALRRSERDTLRALAQAEGARFALVECRAPDAVLRERIERRLAADHDASDATLEVLALQQRVHEPVGADEAAFVLDTDGDPATLARRCEALALQIRGERGESAGAGP